MGIADAIALANSFHCQKSLFDLQKPLHFHQNYHEVRANETLRWVYLNKILSYVAIRQNILALFIRYNIIIVLYLYKWWTGKDNKYLAKYAFSQIAGVPLD